MLDEKYPGWGTMVNQKSSLLGNTAKIEGG